MEKDEILARLEELRDHNFTLRWADVLDRETREIIDSNNREIAKLERELKKLNERGQI